MMYLVKVCSFCCQLLLIYFYILNVIVLMCVACVLFAICAAGYMCLQGMKVKNNKL